MGVSCQRHAPAALYPPGKGPPVPIVQEAGLAPEPVWTQRLEEKSSVWDRTPVVQPVVRHCTDWATASPEIRNNWAEFSVVTWVVGNLNCDLSSAASWGNWISRPSGHGLDDRGSDSWQGELFLNATEFRLTLRPTRPVLCPGHLAGCSWLTMHSIRSVLLCSSVCSTAEPRK
jgi:hypothetical protein